MNDKEKLLKLFDTFGVYDDWYSNEEIVDYLIANGVTVQRWISSSEPPKDHKEYVVMPLPETLKGE